MRVNRCIARMRPLFVRRLLLRSALAALTLPSPGVRAATQASHVTADPVTLGSGGYLLNFDVIWACDDRPDPTTSAPGRIELVDGSGAVIADVVATIGNGNPLIQARGAGTVSGATATVSRLGAGGTPADGFLHASWRITGPAPGAYTLRFWFDQEATLDFPVSTITTRAMDAGGSGPIGGPRSAPPPAVVLLVPASATVFQPVALTATATVSGGGSALASVSIEASVDGGATWMPVAADARPSSPTDIESAAFVFRQAGTAIVRASATDGSGLQASTESALPVAKANQPAIALAPAGATVAQGESVAFTASGGATGSYAWGAPPREAGRPRPWPFLRRAPSPSRRTTWATRPSIPPLRRRPPRPCRPPSSPSPSRRPAEARYRAAAPTRRTPSRPPPPRRFRQHLRRLDRRCHQREPLGRHPHEHPDKSVLAHFTPLLAQTISFAPPGPLTTRSPALRPPGVRVERASRHPDPQLQPPRSPATGWRRPAAPGP